MFPDGKKEKKEIDINDLNVALTYAGQDLTDRWEWYKEKYLKKLQS